MIEMNGAREGDHCLYVRYNYTGNEPQKEGGPE